MPTQPHLHIGAGGHHSEPPLAGVGEDRADERITHTLTPARRRHLRMLELEEIVAQGRIQQLRLAVDERNQEAERWASCWTVMAGRVGVPGGYRDRGRRMKPSRHGAWPGRAATLGLILLAISTAGAWPQAPQTDHEGPKRERACPRDVRSHAHAAARRSTCGAGAHDHRQALARRLRGYEPG